MYQQTLDPIGGSLGWSAVIAAVPLLAMFVMLGVFRWKAHRAALIALALAVCAAIVGWQMPIGQAASATAEGAFYGLFPILWILVNALFVYKLTVVSGWFEELGRVIRSISDDQRILAILIAFCFGALLESLAGFGAPVAISAAMLLAAGMKPLKAACTSLLANTAPVAFGALGAPILALAGVTGLPLDDLSAMAGRQTPFIAAIIPLVMVFLVDGRRGVRQTWPVALVAGLVFGFAQFLTANYFTVELTDVVAAIVTVIAVLGMLKFWSPAETLAATPDVPARDGGRAPVGAGIGVGITTRSGADTTASTSPGRFDHYGRGRRAVYALAPYVTIIAIFSLAQVPVVKSWLADVGTVAFAWPGLDIVDPDGNAVGAQTFKLDHLRATGTLLLLSAVVTTVIYGIGIREALRAYWDTLVQLRWTIVTVTAVLALAFVMNLSGQTGSLGMALASTGGLFAILSPVIGWIGVAITGSDTSSNSLFGVMQMTAAQQAGLDPVLMASANSSAGVLGKMLSPQNLSVAVAAVGLPGSEGAILRKLVGWSLGLLAFLTIIISLQSTPVLGWMVP
ncbi:L-lactate permease [Rhodococcus wratislaviensis]|uniref:L-lactate permease n=1 Tax=Rhodococcus wratislaviensis NBRC 100605 TaxID=1219028 RepID=X0Q1Y4_RHOWR|nr:L-lactate permease [Rhodococcus wratislaviensis]GAF50169.1 putative L-lactate permease [Rhodococcus wratislaviensis NBRC 100605]